NQMQLLAYAIYSTQQDGKTEFTKVKFEKKFGIEKYQTNHAKEDARRLLKLDFSTEDLEADSFEFWNVFQSIKYDNGIFRFKWTDDMIPHILELKEKYVTTDLTITAQFKSGFSWALYDYLKAH
ncbi:replication initiation protein, partial [Sporosarcina sp. OR05]|uniref:replication initiation protein n=1 Tax=Sporosarcina sp. OR05 TaxID=2969819 RepID=UPI00352AD9A9